MIYILLNHLSVMEELFTASPDLRILFLTIIKKLYNVVIDIR